MSLVEVDEFFQTYDIIDHLPNQASGFSATLLKNKSTGEYTLAFRSTEYQNIGNGGDAERDSVRGAAGDVAFNGMAFGQVSSMEKYWESLLDGSRALGAIPDDFLARDTRFVRTAELLDFMKAVNDGAKINVSGYSLGGHLATTFAVLHGERISSLYLFNSAGIGDVQGATVSAYRDALTTYETYMRPENIDAAILRVLDWAKRATTDSRIGAGARLRTSVASFFELPFIPREFQGYIHGGTLSMTAIIGGLTTLARDEQRTGLPLGDDKRPVLASSALHFLVSLFASEPLTGTVMQTLERLAGGSVPSLQERGLIPADVRIFQVSGRAAGGASLQTPFSSMLEVTDWNIVADSGVRAAPDSQLLSVYIENQPTAAGLPFSDRGWGDFGNTHSITLIADSLAVTRMLQKAQPSLAQESAETIYQAASNLRKEHYSILPVSALAEHDTLERVVDAFGRVLFGQRSVGGIDWSKPLASADGTASFGSLQYRDPFYERIQAIENELAARNLAGALGIVSLGGWSESEIAAAAAEASERGTAVRYALKQLNPFYVLGAGLYDALGRDVALALFDPNTGEGAITSRWIEDRSAFLALKLRLGMGDLAYESGPESVLYQAASGDVALSVAAIAGLRAPDEPVTRAMRAGYSRSAQNAAAAGMARLVVFGSDGDPAANPSLVEGGADTLVGKAGADRLYGEGGNDRLLGGPGNDYLEGGSGDDDLSGDQGADVLAGGPGYDTYLWTLGDGNDWIVDTREPSGSMRGRIVLRFDTALVVPRVFQRDAAAPVEAWRSPDRTLLLMHGASWTLSFPDGELDLGTDLRSGDFGFHIEGERAAPDPTVIASIVQDEVIVGPNLAGAIVHGEYGHDRLYAETLVELDAALLMRNEAPRAGWGYWLTAGPGDDVAIGSAASDILAGGGGADTLVGGPGDDLIDGDADSIPVLNGSHLLWDYRPDPAESYFTQFYAPGFATEGTSILPDLYRDQIAEADDVLYGGSGNDRMYGGGGDDSLYGDPGDDVLVGGAGSDVLFGGEGADRLTGELHGYAPVGSEVVGNTIVTYPHYVPAYGDDILDGGAGDDELTGEGGADVLFGGDGADIIYGDIAGLPGPLHGNDVADGGAGDDLIYGQGGADLLFGGPGNDRLYGDSDVEALYHGADTLHGDDGDDLLVGAGGADSLFGGAGADVLIGDAPDVPLEFQLGDVLDGGEGDDVLYGLGGADDLFGSDGHDRLYGDDPDAPFLGDADRLDGGNGNDILFGHAGDDYLQGGSGDDMLFGDAGNDTVAGGPGADVLDGGSGDNVYDLSPGDGVDRLVAGAGLVTLAFAEGTDVATLRASRIFSAPGIAPLEIWYSENDAVRIEQLADDKRLRIRIGDAELLSGAELLQIAQSSSAPLLGSEGSELLVADPMHPEVFALLGDDLVLGSDGDDRLHGGAGDDELYGADGNDIVLGDDGADRLFGGPGDDRLEGGPGDDRYGFVPGEGSDRAIEAAGEGFDVVTLPPGYADDAIRFRRSGNDLVLAERGGDGRLFLPGWFAPNAQGDRGIEAVLHDGGTLDAEALLAREIADKTLLGTAGSDTLIGDEFEDVVIGGPGDDLLAGLGGDDRYEYERGDGNDRIDDSGGYDLLAFGAGIVPGEIELVAAPDGQGGLAIALRLATDGAQIVFGEARSRRIDAFRFASGEELDYATLVARVGGIRLEGGDANDVLSGSFYSDALYGFAGDDMLWGDAGSDLLVGAEGHDVLAGGANDDTYVFNRGDGRDSIVEYEGSDEYLLFRGYFTATGRRAFDLDGVTFETSEPLPGFFGETFNLTLGSVAGGVDTIRFGEGIAPEDIRFGLDLSKPLLSYSWLVPQPSGELAVGTALTEQVAYVLEIGSEGDAIELVWPDVELEEHAAQTRLDQAPVERLVFADAEAVTLADVFAVAGGLTYVIGSTHDDVLSVERVLPGGWLAGGPGDDVYLRPEQGNLGILEAPDGGTDTIVFGEGVAADALRLVLEGERLFLDTSAGRVELREFVPSFAERALVDRFELVDGSSLDYGALLARGIEVAGTPFSDQLGGTSAYDFVVAGAGNDTIDSAGGNDVIDAGAGNDLIIAGPGDDWIAAGAGDDLVRGGAGRDRYLVLRGDGDDVIEELGVAGEDDTIQFAGNIVPAQIDVHRSGADLVLGIAASLDRVTVRGWFDSSAMRVEHVVFNDGTDWDTATIAALAGEPLPVDPVDEPALAPQTEPAEAPEATPSEPAPSSPQIGQPEAFVPAPDAAPPPPVASQDSTPTPDGAPAPDPELPQAALQPPEATGAATADFGNADVAAGTLADVPATLEPSRGASRSPERVASLSGSEAASGTESDGSVLSSTPLVVPSSDFEGLAAEGFVSPGRPLGSPQDADTDAAAPETVAPDAAPAEDGAADVASDEPAAAAMAAYWRWLHAQLRAHLESTQVDDLAAPPMYEERPLALFRGEAMDAMAPSRSVGIRDRSAYDGRIFDGLRDGLTLLG